MSSDQIGHRGVDGRGGIGDIDLLMASWMGIVDTVPVRAEEDEEWSGPLNKGHPSNANTFDD